MNDDLDPRQKAIIERLIGSASPIDPPHGLADRTVAYVLSADATPSTIAQGHAEAPVFLGRRRADLIVAAMIGFVAFTLGLSYIQKQRAESAKLACQNALRDVHGSLAEYADHHAGHYPVGSTAGGFADELQKAGVAPASLVCPADSEPRPIGFTYTLGYRVNGRVIGFRKPDPARDDDDGMPLVADFPASGQSPTTGPASPHGHGQNVLFAGGFVRFTTSPLVGLNGDNIYTNRNGVVAAGLSPTDACLGRPGDRP